MAGLLIAAGTAVAANAGAIATSVAVSAAVSIAQRALAPDQNVTRQGTRLENSQIVTSNEGSAVPELIGRNRIAGQVMWQTTFRESITTETDDVSSGKGGPSNTVTTETYNYHCSFAIGLCQSDGSARIGQMWADGKPLSMGRHTIRVYNGSPDQLPDPKIEAVEGAGNVPAYRGLCYILFDEMLLEEFGNRIPQITVEVINIPDRYRNENSMESTLRAVNIIPSTGEFQYGTREHLYEKPQSGETGVLNSNAFEDGSDFEVAMDQLQESVENISSASLVVSWFGTSLNAAECEVLPKLDRIGTNFIPSDWRVSDLVSDDIVVNLQTGLTDSKFVPELEYGGTPSDISVREAMMEIKNRGLRAMFYPFILMDTPGYPWRGRVTGSATTFTGTVQPSDFTGWNGSQVPYSGPDEWSQRRMILHYAWLLKDIFTSGDVFLVGSEMVGLSEDDNWGTLLASIIADVRQILPAGVKISYASDWSEYKMPSLASLWPSADFIGIDNYLPITDWRDGDEVYEPQHFIDGITSGEYWDYFYADDAGRLANDKRPITDPQFRQKDIRYWRDNNQPGKEIYFTEFGCAAVDKGGNQPNTFFDPKSDESRFPYFSDGRRNDYVQRLYTEAMLTHFAEDGLVDPANMFVWTWDARPYPYFPSNTSIWDDGPNWERGHWLTGRLDSLSLDKVILAICEGSGLTEDQVDVTGVSSIFTLVRGVMWSDLNSNRDVLQNILTTFHVDSYESDGKLVFSPKSMSDEVVIDSEDYLVNDPTAQSFSRPKVQASDLPQSTIVEFVDEHRNYQIAAVSGRRINTASSNVDRFSSLSIISTDYAQSLADALTHEKWVARDTLTFSLPLGYKDLRCGNWFRDGRRYKILQLTFGDQIDVEAMVFNEGVYSTVEHATSTPIITSPVSIGRSMLVAAEIPLADEGIVNHWSPRILTRQEPWPGGVNLYLDDGSGGYTFNTRSTIPSILGELTEDLYSGPVSIWDHYNEMTVRLLDGNTLSSVSETSVLNGANTIAVQTTSGEWEIIQFVNATLNGDGTYTLSQLLRGQLGTEFYMGSPSVAGSKVFVVDYARMTQMSGTIGRLNLDVDARHGPIGFDVADARYTDTEITPRGVALRPYSPVHLSELYDGNDIILTWVRRTRFEGDGWDGEVPLKEEFEQYSVDIFDGAAVVRTIQVDNATTLTYSEAQQIADFGAAQTSLTWRVYQISNNFGRGTQADG